MPSLVVSNFASGFETDRPPFFVNNDAFPVLNNAFIWRGRVRKKRGANNLGRLTRKLTDASLGNSPASATWTFTIYSTLVPTITGESTAQIVPGLSPYTLVITDGTDTFTDIGDGTLSGGIGGSTINYSTGSVTLKRSVALANAFTITFYYFPTLPVMGIRDFNRNFTTSGFVNFPLTVFFDTKYSYLYNQSFNDFYDVNFYASTGNLFTWHGTNYQQFNSTNFQGAMWATNNVPGFEFITLTLVVPGLITTFTTSAAHNLSDDDFVFINEVGGVTGINGMTGQVTVTGANTFTLAITSGGAYTTGGIAQYLTSPKGSNQDGIKYFIQDPTGTTPNGWVNFMPPLQNTGLTGDNPQYLVGAKIIIPFKNRLLFFGVWTQTSDGSPAIYNPNLMIANAFGTVFYAGPSVPNTLPNSLIVPFNQSASAGQYYTNVVKQGFSLLAPISQEIICASINLDTIIVIFENLPLKLYSTGDGSFPFLYQTIASEFGAQSTFSSISLDNGVLSIGPYGFTMTNTESSQRIDLKIPDQVFSISKLNNGLQRVCAVRDFREEFVYFTYPVNGNPVSNSDQLLWTFPTTTLAYNYRDNTWSTFTENYTSYGYFRFSSGYTWSNVGEFFPTWASWSNPWNFGANQAQYPYVACGNQQGFVMLREQELTAEENSEFIQAISGNTITSPNHNLNPNDFIQIQNCIGDAGIEAINGQIYQISTVSSTPNTFTLIPLVDQPTPTGSYIGGGVYIRLSKFNVLTKQFPVLWQNERKTRIGTQKYLLDTTHMGALTVNLFTNQDTGIPSNSDEWSTYLPFTNILPTHDSSNNGLNITQYGQNQIWQRINTSVIGDTVQLGFTLSDDQMRDNNSNQNEITMYGFSITIYPGPPLAT